jgi:alpha-D-ribose 1-methylphosphonate 5-triphosphate synthase subunit PhnG
MNIIAMKLVTGEDVLGELESQSETEFVIVNPVGITVVRGKDGNPSIGFSPFPLHAEPKTGATVALAKRNVVYSYVPAEDFINNYEQIFGTGLIVPKQQSIITG